MLCPNFFWKPALFNSVQDQTTEFTVVPRSVRLNHELEDIDVITLPSSDEHTPDVPEAKSGPVQEVLCSPLQSCVDSEETFKEATNDDKIEVFPARSQRNREPQSYLGNSYAYLCARNKLLQLPVMIDTVFYYYSFSVLSS